MRKKQISQTETQYLPLFESVPFTAGNVHSHIDMLRITISISTVLFVIFKFTWKNSLWNYCFFLRKYIWLLWCSRGCFYRSDCFVKSSINNRLASTVRKQPSHAVLMFHHQVAEDYAKLWRHRVCFWMILLNSFIIIWKIKAMWRCTLPCEILSGVELFSWNAKKTNKRLIMKLWDHKINYIYTYVDSLLITFFNTYYTVFNSIKFNPWLKCMTGPFYSPSVLFYEYQVWWWLFSVVFSLKRDFKLNQSTSSNSTSARPH